MSDIGEPYFLQPLRQADFYFAPPDPTWGGTGLLLTPPELQDAPPFSEHPRIQAMIETGAPASADLSPLSGGILNQGSYPRCSSYSSAAVKSYEEKIESGGWYPFDPDLLFQEGGGSDSSGGVMENMAQVCQTKGALRKDTGQRYKIQGWLKARRDPAGFREDVKAAIAAQKPVQLALLLPQNFGWSSSGAPTTGYHAVAAIGYDENWVKIQNSWGAGFGNAGFGRVPWNYLEQNNFLNGYNYALVWTDVVDSGPTPPPPGPTDEVQQVLAAHNAYRQQAGLQPLALQSQLTAAAQGFAQTLSTWTGFDHTGPDGSTPFSRIHAAGYTGGTMGENIARGFATATNVMDAWKNSPGHWANILYANYRHAGIGIANGPQGKSWVCDFGAGGSDTGPTPPPPTPPPIPTPLTVGVTATASGIAVSINQSLPVGTTVTVGVREPDGSTASGTATVGGITPPPPPPPPVPVGDPVIDTVQPVIAAVGQNVVISGRNFGTVPGVVGFTFHVGARIVSWSDTQITVTVPAGAVAGPLAVQRADDTAAQHVAFHGFTVIR